MESILSWNENSTNPATDINVQTYYHYDFGSYLTSTYIPILVAFLSQFYISFLLILPFAIVILLVCIHDKVAEKR